MTVHNNGISDGTAMPRSNSLATAAERGDVDAARHNVNVAKAQLRADLSRVTSVGEGVARRAWVSARPALIIGGAALGAFIVYKLVAGKRHSAPAPLIRIVLPKLHSQPEQKNQVLSLVRSVGLSLGAALLRSWLERVSARPEALDKPAAFDSLVGVEQPEA